MPLFERIPKPEVIADRLELNVIHAAGTVDNVQRIGFIYIVDDVKWMIPQTHRQHTRQSSTGPEPNVVG